MAGERFVWERHLRADASARGSRLLVLLMLGTYHDRHSETATASHGQLAEACGVSESTVARALAWAREHHYLDLVERGHRLGDGRTVASTYALTLPVNTSRVTGRGLLNPSLRDVLTSASTRQEAHLNTSEEASQPVTHDTPSGVSPSGTSSSLTPRAPDDEEEPMRDYPIDSTDARERREQEPAEVDVDRERTDAAEIVEHYHPELRPDEVDAVVDLLRSRGRLGYRAAKHRDTREQCVAEVKAQRRRAANGLAWYDALGPDDRAVYEAAARQSLAAQGDDAPDPAVLRARVIRLYHRDARTAAVA